MDPGAVQAAVSVIKSKNTELLRAIERLLSIISANGRVVLPKLVPAPEKWDDIQRKPPDVATRRVPVFRDTEPGFRDVSDYQERFKTQSAINEDLRRLREY